MLGEGGAGLGLGAMTEAYGSPPFGSHDNAGYVEGFSALAIDSRDSLVIERRWYTFARRQGSDIPSESICANKGRWSDKCHLQVEIDAVTVPGGELRVLVIGPL